LIRRSSVCIVTGTRFGAGMEIAPRSRGALNQA
jgi:hypothetical protein